MLIPNKIEKSFNPRLSVPNYKIYLNNSIKKASIAKRYLNGIYDLKYGKSTLQTMDVFLKKKAINHLYTYLFMEVIGGP